MFYQSKSADFRDLKARQGTEKTLIITSCARSSSASRLSQEKTLYRHYLERRRGFANPVWGNEYELIEADSSVPYERIFA